MQIKDIQEQLKIFDAIKFSKHNHKYKIENTNFHYSVTEYIEKFLVKESDKFNADYWSKIIAARRNIPVQEVLKEWKEKGDVGADSGTRFHDMVSSCYKKESKNITLPIKIVKYFQNFLRDTDKILTPIDSEIVIGIKSKDIDIAGTIDQLFWSNDEEGIVLYDWKTNKKYFKYIDTDSVIIKPNQIDELTYNKLSYQVQLYKMIIHSTTKLKIKSCYIGWFSMLNNNYKILKCTKEPIIKNWPQEVSNGFLSHDSSS